MKNRFIFDLDGTLLQWDDRDEYDFFSEKFETDDVEESLKRMIKLISDYEVEHERYEVERLADYLTEKTGVEISPDFINEWNIVCLNMEKRLVPGVEDVLKYLKSKGKSLVVLTNWFAVTQVGRLEKSGLLKYFDEVITGEYFTKPHKESYLKACGDYNLEECIMIGDDYKKDYQGAIDTGIDALLISEDDKYKDCNTIKDIRELKEMF